MEEERRLCFVGITRAEEHLLLSKAAYRTLRGLRERTVTSPFLMEIPQECLEVVDHTGLSFGSRGRELRERAALEHDHASTRFKVGQLVRHPTFGIGRIQEITDMGSQTRAVIQFNAAGKKTLILEYARLEAAG
jgi:DNA helicase-2/ATP-dependent DNA helicase PcrA